MDFLDQIRAAQGKASVFASKKRASTCQIMRVPLGVLFVVSLSAWFLFLCEGTVETEKHNTKPADTAPANFGLIFDMDLLSGSYPTDQGSSDSDDGYREMIYI